jgi:hypothetical protein
MMPFDKAVDLLRNLSEADYEAATRYILSLASNRYSPEKPLSRAELLEDLAISRQQEKEGRHVPAGQAFDAVMEEYGLVRR